MNQNDKRNATNRDDLERWEEKQVTNNPSGSFHNEIDTASEESSTEERREEESDRIRHHQAHGIRHYESFKNRSSADDQPMTDTGA